MKEVLNQQWRDVPNYPDLQVKEDGKAVRAIKSLYGSTQKNPRYYNYSIKQDTFGRAYIKRKPNGADQVLFVDELVADSFCPQKSGCFYIAHKDFDITNNHYDNLEWVNRDDYFSKYHQNRIKVKYGERFAWWKNNWYISEIGHLLIDGWLYGEKYIFTNIDDYDVGFRRATHAFIPYGDEHIHIEDGVKTVWNKVILHKDGDYGNWQETNLKAVESNAPEAQYHEKLWTEWKRKEDIRLFQERFPNDPIPSFIK